MFETIVYVTAAASTALLAGVFLAYSISINGALRTLDDAGYVRTMQAIDRAIRNPLFFLSFMGPIVLLPLAAFLAHGSGVPFMAWLAAAVLYFAGPFGITVGGNEPLNQRLTGFQLADASPESVTATRRAFEASWNRLHSWRTALAVIAALLAIGAAVA